jgi:hypothetical protein
VVSAVGGHVWFLRSELAKVESAEEHRKARTMIDTLIRPASPAEPADVQTTTEKSAARSTRRGRLWVLLHAQALLSGRGSDVDFVEDDRRRMGGS